MAFISIVIPAYNEQKRLPRTLDLILDYLAQRPALSSEVIVVDDGSSDSTANLVEDYAGRNPSIRLLRNPGNRGKGYAVRNGMLAARGEWILFTDADLSAPIEELDTLLAAATADQGAVLIGSRAINRTLIAVRQPVFREYMGRFFNVVMRLVTGLPFRDTQCGFKLYRADAGQAVFSRQQMEGFSFDVEDLVIAQARGFRTIEVPVRWSDAPGTKVSAWNGFRSFVDLLRIRWYQLSGRYR